MNERPSARLRHRIGGAGDPLLLPGAPNALTARMVEESRLRGRLRLGRRHRQHLPRRARTSAWSRLSGARRPRRRGARRGRPAHRRRRRYRLRQCHQRDSAPCGCSSGPAPAPSSSRTRSRPSGADTSRARRSSPLRRWSARSRPQPTPARTTQLVLIARTDALALHGLSARLRAGRAVSRSWRRRRLRRGAASPSTDLRSIPRRVSGPTMVNIVEGGKTPNLAARRPGRVGISHRPLRQHRDARGDARDALGAHPPARRRATRWRSATRSPAGQTVRALVRKGEFDALDQRYAARPA